MSKLNQNEYQNQNFILSVIYALRIIMTWVLVKSTHYGALSPIGVHINKINILSFK